MTHRARASGNGMAVSFTLWAKQLLAVAEMSEVGQLVRAAMPIEYLIALGVGDAAFDSLCKHLTSSLVLFVFLIRRGGCSAKPTVESILALVMGSIVRTGR